MLKAVKETARELQINEHLLDDAFRDCLIQIKHTLQKPEMPKVLIHGFGTFRVPLERVDSIITKELKKYQEGKLSREFLKNRLVKLFKIRRRLKDEKKARARRTKKKNPKKKN